MTATPIWLITVRAEPPGRIHGRTRTTAIAMITKPWDDCEVPLVRVAPTGQEG